LVNSQNAKKGGAFAIRVERLSLRLVFKNWSVRLGVRTPDFHSGNTGSIPVQTTNEAGPEAALSGFAFFIQSHCQALFIRAASLCPEATAGLLQASIAQCSE
jgi:hypothetical protein